METKAFKNPMGKKKPTFCKMLLPGYNTDRLAIPQTFLKHISNELSERATLKLKVSSSDCSWDVKIRTKNGQVYMEDGWQGFLKDNLLGDNETLIFIYDGKMNFSIDVFDKNGCDRVDFPNIKSPEKSTFANTTKRPRRRTRKEALNSCNRLHSSDDSVEILSSSESIEFQDFNEEEDEPSVEIISSSESSEFNEEEGDSVNDRSEEWEEDAEPQLFESQSPHFNRVITHSKNVYVPKAFSMEHFPGGKYEKAILKNAEGREWEVKVVAYSQKGQYFSAGWGKFLSDNRISIGDTCIFELLSKNKMMVHILRKRSV